MKTQLTNTLYVFALKSGSIYEGGGLNGLYITELLARSEAVKLVDKYNKWAEEINAGEGDYDFKPYTEKENNNWDNGIDYIRVDKINVQSS